MQLFNNLKIGTRIATVLAMFAAGLIGVTLIGLNALTTYDRNADQMENMADRAILRSRPAAP